MEKSMPSLEQARHQLKVCEEIADQQRRELEDTRKRWQHALKLSQKADNDVKAARRALFDVINGR